jgi:transcriptional regulator of arginine metabolism
MRDARQKLIRRLLDQRAIPTQGALREALAERGFEVDQSTLSRDLHELGVRKAGGRYAIPSADAAAVDVQPNYGVAVRSFQPCGPHMIVIRTDIGQAQPVALWIDQMDETAIVATLAGDDTVFAATKNRKTQAVALRRMEVWFGDKRER